MKRKRRRRVKTVAAGTVLVVLWVLLGGPGLPAGSGPADVGESGSNSSGSGKAASNELPLDESTTEVVSKAAPRSVSLPAVDLPTEPDAPIDPSAEPEVVDGSALAQARVRYLAESDDLAGFLHDLRTAVDGGQLGAAFCALDGARELTLETASLRERREAVGQELLGTLRSQVEGLLELVVSGPGRPGASTAESAARDPARDGRRRVDPRPRAAGLAVVDPARWGDAAVRGGGAGPRSPGAGAVPPRLVVRSRRRLFGRGGVAGDHRRGANVGWHGLRVCAADRGRADLGDGGGCRRAGACRVARRRSRPRRDVAGALPWVGVGR